ncbi:MAG: gliding motility-associated ABC transporter substrate-binding protein GldG, partial [Bacteroidota bacterium]|nr:gliding motility-associated ABC transporter substrate-binding protein GldG [Bacteroidota bacterium]
VSSLDTIQVGNVRKSILLSSSDYSRTVNVPVYINLNILDQEPDERLYQGPGQPIAVLLEGVFESNFVNRIPPVLQYDKSIKFKEVSRPTKMIIVSDGDVIRNQLHYKDGYPLPLGFDQYTRQTFGNKEFILNAMNYLTEGEGLISIRSRELKLRLLDMTRVNNSKLYWQLLNVLVPILAVILFGVTQAIIRKRKYSKS